ncbi:TadE/TadG family type IV pilus assembly protein [Mixta gaviniae]|nr:TadE/TadG family type IV pilus assembly protein [Mixta gaviniae]
MSVITRMVSRFIGNERGGIIIPFAIMLPTMLALLALGLNSAHMMIKKARIADAASEATLAVAAAGLVNNEESDRLQAQATIDQFMRYYAPTGKVIDSAFISVDESAGSREKRMRYRVSATVNFPFLLPSTLYVGGEADKDFTFNFQGGQVIKASAKPADIVFVVDFSTSQQGAGIKLLKEVVDSVSRFVLENNSNSRIALVPFSTGVTVKLPITNERGGEVPGCSVLFVPKPGYDINYLFWADKALTADKSWGYRHYHMDYWRYHYYYYFVSSGQPAMTLAQMRAKWCLKNTKWGGTVGRFEYSCKSPEFPYSDIFSPASQQIIYAEYDKAYKVQQKQGTALTIEHDEAIDYEATLEKMFSDEAIITFPMVWGPMDDYNYRAYSHMCHQGGWNHHQINNDFTRAKVRAWLIELTNDQAVLDQFQHMEAQGYTHLSSGLIRSVPVMMKGINKRKIFILLSDGDDSAEPAKVTKKWLESYKLCEKIEQGILARPETNASVVEFYYISTTISASRVKYWADNCTGEKRASTSTKRDELIKLIKNIMNDEVGRFT